jgi:Arc/MetJ-type ribon-helix-helix transcriptional regulator
MTKKGKPMKTSVAIDPELLEWIDSMVEKKRFATRTHAIELGLQLLKERSETTETFSNVAKQK